MQKIGASTASANALGEFTEGNPGAGIPATLLKAAWLNAVQRELAHIVEGAGLALDAADDSQVFKAIQAIQANAATWLKLGGKPTTVAGFGITDAFTKPETAAAIQQAIASLVASSPAALDTLKELADALGDDPNFATTMTNALSEKASIASIQSQEATAFTTAGTAAALTLTPIPAITAYSPSLRFRVKFSQASNGSGTLNASGIGAKSLKQYDAAGAKVPAVYAVGQLGDVEYDGTDFMLLNQLPAASTLLDSVRIGVASAETVNLTTAAPNTRHINITGTTNISAFTVAAGQCYFVRFAGPLLLVNSASLTTQSGRNITTFPGDTCIIRATAANTVEVLCYVPGGGWDSSMGADGYQRLPSGLILQWGRSSAVIAANGGILNVAFPVTYPTDVFFSSVQIVSCSPSNGALAVEAVATTTANLQITNRDTDSAITQLRWFSLGR